MNILHLKQQSIIACNLVRTVSLAEAEGPATGPARGAATGPARGAATGQERGRRGQERGRRGQEPGRRGQQETLDGAAPAQPVEPPSTPSP